MVILCGTQYSMVQSGLQDDAAMCQTQPAMVLVWGTAMLSTV